MSEEDNLEGANLCFAMMVSEWAGGVLLSRNDVGTSVRVGMRIEGAPMDFLQVFTLTSEKGG